MRAGLLWVAGEAFLHGQLSPFLGAIPPPLRGPGTGRPAGRCPGRGRCADLRSRSNGGTLKQ